MKHNSLLLFLVGLIFSIQAYCQVNIVTYGSNWKYLDNGTDQGSAWSATAFSDAAWASGNGQLGYGDGDEATVVGYGPNASTKYVTTYFRKSININNPAAFSSITANIKRDDGVIVYINGNEVYRNNLATGTVTYTTLATLADDDGATPQTFSISPAAFVAGTNVIAVEVHQNSVTSSDISFDLEIKATINTSLVPYGSNWKYKDNGSNLGTGWRNLTYNDGAWASGNAQLGYGDGDEATVVSYGPNASSKYITTYFRKSVNVPDTTLFTGYTLNLKRDDGAVVYINSKEVFRTNMPTGTISYTTKASADASDDGNTPQTKTLTISQVRKGNNVIAVEIHQNVRTSSDISFDLELKGITPAISAALTRGPYLNSATQNSIVVRWRTDVPTSSKVSYGTSAGSLTLSKTDTAQTTEHIITLTGLAVNTKYFYSIGSATQTLQGDASNYFKTMPPVGSTQKSRFLVMGDMGNNSTNQVNVRNAYISYNGTNFTDGFILLGDNAYNSGTDAEYQTNFYNIYQGNLTKNHVLWPAPGNHDYANSSARQADHLIPYYDMFSLPKNGEAGGIASNTEAYYSYNYGNIHFVALDSYGWEAGSTRLYDTAGAQATWLKQDLAANTQPWTVVYFHHPPYTLTSHNSDSETELINMRQKIVPILERFKVDLVLSGHSHGYERSYLLNGHYGLESTFSLSAHALSSSSAKYDGTTNSCVYSKNPTDQRNGIVYAVVGSSGQLGGTSTGYPHNAMYYSNVTNGGAMLLEVENNRLDAKWICADGVVRDNFTMMKNINKVNNITISAGSSAVLTASWTGTYNWSTSATSSSITVSPATSSTYTVTDAYGCITDVFNVTVTSNRTASQIGNHSWTVQPTLISKGQSLHVSMTGNTSDFLQVIDIHGKLVLRQSVFGEAVLETGNLAPGMYILRLESGEKGQFQKIIVTE